MKFINKTLIPKNKLDFHEKIVPKLFMLSLPIIVLSPLIPTLIIFLPTEISHIFSSVLAIYLGLILLTLSLSLFFSSKIMNRLTAIPINFVMALLGFIIYKFNLYLLLLNSFSLGPPFTLTSEIIDEGMNLITPLSIIGIWISCLPIIFYSLHLFFKSAKKKDFTNHIQGQGYIKNVFDTHTKINNNRVYHVVLDIQYELDKQFVVEKDFIIPNHIVHAISIGNKVDVLIDCNNHKDVYIQTAYGIF